MLHLYEINFLKLLLESYSESDHRPHKEINTIALDFQTKIVLPGCKTHYLIMLPLREKKKKKRFKIQI